MVDRLRGGFYITQQAKRISEVKVTDREPLLRVENLCRHFARRGFGSGVTRAVDGISLRIERGQTLALVGESGCGKTTAARTMIGLYPPTSGAVFLDGERIDRIPRAVRTRRLQMVFQDFGGPPVGRPESDRWSSEGAFHAGRSGRGRGEAVSS